MTKLTQAQKAKMSIELIILDKTIFEKLDTLDCEKEKDEEHGTIDYLFSDNSILRYTTDETFISLIKTW